MLARYEKIFALTYLLLILVFSLLFLNVAEAAPADAAANVKASSSAPTADTDTGTPSNSSNTKYNLKWTSRSAWQAVPPLHAPTRIFAMDGVSLVIIHHTATPAAGCRRSPDACAATVRAIQRTHQQQRGWDDIGYNFLIGGSEERAEIYEGRGFDVVGAHAGAYNARSVGIAIIGDWTDTLPPRVVLDKLQQLITYGVQMGHIQRSYVLLGHRQVRATECPGNRLYNELKVWPHYAKQAV